MRKHLKPRWKIGEATWGRAHYAPSTGNSQPESEKVKQNTGTRMMLMTESPAAEHLQPEKTPREQPQQNNVAKQQRRWYNIPVSGTANHRKAEAVSRQSTEGNPKKATMGQTRGARGTEVPSDISKRCAGTE